MRSALLPALAFVSAAAAQAPTLQPFTLYPGSTSYATRLTLPGPSAGAVVQTYEATRFHGTAQIATSAGVVGRLHGFRAVIQDEDASTAQAVGFSLLADDPAAPGRPLTTPAGVLASAGPFPLPPSPTPIVSAWILTVSLATPADVVPQSGTFHAAADLPAAPLWTNDGLSVHSYSHSLSVAPRPGTPILVGAIDRTNGNAWSQPALGETIRLELLVEAPVLTMGVDLGPLVGTLPSPTFGILGIYPDRARGDGLAWKVEDGNHAGSTVVLLASAGAFGSGLPIPGLDGIVWLDPNRLFPVVLHQGRLTLGGTWSAVVPWAAFPASLPQVPITYQALVLPAGGTPLWTNAASTS